MPRTLAFGDIHGCLMAFDTLLGFVQPTPEDQLIFLGDYVDRGPDSKGVVNRLIELHRTGRAICLRGNHEVMMHAASQGFDDLKYWLHFGGMDTLESYGSMLGDVPFEHWYFIERKLINFHETDSHVYVHANLCATVPIAEQSNDWLHWQLLTPLTHAPHISGKTMICGHSQQVSGRPMQLERAVCIDTWVYGDGWLTCLDVDSGEYWQANEFGQTRMSTLAADRI